MNDQHPPPVTDGQVEAVRRTVRIGDRTSTSVNAASTLSQTYPTDVDDLWQACTSPERLTRWFAPVTGDLQLGGRYQIEGNAGGEVRACEPPKTFTLSWEFGGGATEVVVRVEPDGDGARLTLEHTGDVPLEFWDQFGPGATGVGWDLALLGLAGHLRTGHGKPEDEEAWTMSPEAQAFIIECSRAWGDADIDAGTPEAEARAAQGRTTAFYTGVAEPVSNA
ncbi:MAG: SRPBCC family protein [Propionibacteriales bacterium]|nr:SRPBCC family protein [Propionibacteriales bacterium]